MPVPYLPGALVNNDQLDFSFVAELPSVEAIATKRVARPKSIKPLATSVQATLQPLPQQHTVPLGDAESMAIALESHPDYRVGRSRYAE